MITFYPGPSKVYPQVEQFLQEAYHSGILSQNHRSGTFMTLLEQCIALLKEKLLIPTDYSIYFVSSATECWEISAQSLFKNKTAFYFNGAFGKKWFENAAKISETEIQTKPFLITESIDKELLSTDFDTVCITQNETSNGTEISEKALREIRKHHADALICVDATSSMAGIKLDWTLGDFWFASVQKCFGLPAGLGIIVASPKCLERANEVNENKHYNSLLFIEENFSKFQTHHTPNVLGIYLLKRVMGILPSIEIIHQKTIERAASFADFLQNEAKLELLIEDEELRSKTVFAIKANEQQLVELKKKALENDITLGNGYGNWKNNTFRIANFPAIEDWEFEKLKKLWN